MRVYQIIKEILKIILTTYLVFILSGMYNAAVTFADDANNILQNTDASESCNCGCRMESIEDCSCCNSRSAEITAGDVICGCSIEKSMGCLPHDDESTLTNTSDYIVSGRPAIKSSITKTRFKCESDSINLSFQKTVFHPPSDFLS